MHDAVFAAKQSPTLSTMYARVECQLGSPLVVDNEAADLQMEENKLLRITAISSEGDQ